MKCQILFSWENTKNIINLLSAELAQRVVKVKNNQNVSAFTDICNFRSYLSIFNSFYLTLPHCHMTNVSTANSLKK